MAALVQKTAQFFFDGVTSASRSITGVTAGNTVIATVAICAQPNTVPTPALATPTGGWTAAVAPSGASTVDSYKPATGIFFKANAAAGTHTVTWTGTLPTDTYGEVTLSEWSGLDTSAPLDVTAFANFDSSGVGGGTTAGNAGTTAATSALGGVVIAVGNAGGAGSLLSSPPATGYTLIDTEPNASAHLTYDAGYKLLSGSGTQTASWAWSGNANFQGVQAAFKNAGGGGGTPAVLEAAPAAVATLTGELTTQKRLNATAADVATLTAALTTQKRLNAALVARSTITAALTTQKRLNATPAAVASLSAALTTQKLLAADLGAVSTMSGTLAGDGAAFSATAQAVSTLTGGLSTAIRPAATLQASASLAGTLTDNIAGAALAAALAAQAGAAASLTTAKTLNASMAASATLTAELTGGSAAVNTRGGSELGPRRYERKNVKPILQRMLEAKAEARAPEVRAQSGRAAKRVKRIENEAARALADDPTDADAFEQLFRQWEAEAPIAPTAMPGIDPRALFEAQVAYRIRQLELAQQLRQAIAAAEAQDEEDAILAMLLA